MARTVDAARHGVRRGELLAAAARCVVRDGFRGASIAQICAEAGISPGHLYHYFPSKEAIVGAIIEHQLADAEAFFARLARADDGMQALLDEVQAGTLAHAARKRALTLEVLAEAGRNKAIARLLRRHHRALRDLVAGFLRQGQERGQVDPALDAQDAAAMLLSVVDGAGTLAIRDPARGRACGPALLARLIARFLAPASN
jgi:TetR/AcrR family transcriptional regulator, repressor for uid operon